MKQNEEKLFPLLQPEIFLFYLLNWLFVSGCAPAKCGRMVSDTVIDESDANQLLTLAKKGLSKGGGAGGASILDLHSGALSKGEGFVSVYQTFPDLFSQDDFEIYRCV